MKRMYQTISDALTNPVPALATTGTVATAGLFGIGLPEVIQFFTAIYAVLLAAHKIWQMYQEYVAKRDAYKPKV